MNIQLFVYSVDLLQSLLWQYNQATNLQSLIAQKQEWYTTNQSNFWSDWYDDVFNLVTADLFGLAVWSIILDVPLFVYLGEDDHLSTTLFGFNEVPTINTYQNFTFGNFTNRNQVLVLSEEEQRLVLRLRYYQLTSRGAIPEINAFLNSLFTTSVAPYHGAAWALDGLDMTMVYIFDFAIPHIMLKILIDLDLLPRPATVGLRYIILTGTIFGFGSDDLSIPNSNNNFENSNFYPEYL